MKQTQNRYDSKTAKAALITAPHTWPWKTSELCT